MTSLLAPALTIPLEKLLNELLQQDALALKQLRALSALAVSGAPVIDIHCTTPIDGHLYLVLAGSQVQLRSHYDGPLAAGIHGSATHFMSLLLNKNPDRGFISPALRLEGDTELIQGLQQLLQTLDIDWETHLARLSGDTLSHQLGRMLQSTRDVIRQSASTLQMNLSEYLQEESRLLPQAAELEHFYEEVDGLRLRLDRLQARLERLQGPKTGL